MGMETLSKALTNGRDWYAEQKAYNETWGVQTDCLNYFAWKAREEHGIGIENAADLERREKMFLRRFNVKDGEWNREQKVRQYAHDSWIVEKYYAEHDCPIYGPHAPALSKAQTTGPLAAAFPIFYESNVWAGRLENPILPRIVTNTITNTASGVAEHVELTDTATTPSGAIETVEGARGAQVSVTFRSRQIPLKTFKYETLASYKALSRIRLPILAQLYQRVGRRFEYLLSEFGLDVIILGDTSSVTLESGASGTASNAAETEAADTAGTPDYDDALDLYFKFDEGYSPNLGIASGPVLQNALNIAEFKDSQLFTFARDGGDITFLGVPHVRWDSKGYSSGYTNTKLLWMDTSGGLTQYTDGGILSESERLISEGWEKTVISLDIAFAVNDAEAQKVGTSWAS